MGFNEEQYAVAVTVAERLSRVDAEQWRHEDMRSQLRDFLEDPGRPFLRLQTTRKPKRTVLEITREAFFSQWLNEISAHHPELQQFDTIDDMTVVNSAALNSTPFTGLRVTDISETLQRIEQHAAKFPPAERKPKTGAQAYEAPFRTLVVQADHFMRACHAEPLLAYALMIRGEGYFSFPKGDGWYTEHTGTGVLCVEPPCGIHAGQTRDVGLFAVVTAKYQKHKIREGNATTVDLNIPADKPVSLVHEDPNESVYCYILTLQKGTALQLPIGIYYVFKARSACRIEGDGPVVEIESDHSFAWNGTDGRGTGTLRLSGEDAVVLAICRSAIAGKGSSIE